MRRGVVPCRHSLQDECRILLLHGLLHLLGHDHELGDAESDSMAQQEQELLQCLSWKVEQLQPTLSHCSTVTL